MNRHTKFQFSRLLLLMILLGGLVVLAACSSESSGRVGGASGRNVAVAAAVDTQTPAASNSTILPTFTPVPTLTGTATPGPTPTPSRTPTASPQPSETAGPTATPTSVPQSIEPVPNFGTPYPYLTATPPTAVPTAVATFEVPGGVTNILLLGSDEPIEGELVGRTDTIMIVSVNRDTQTASMLSIPRDTLVYVPGGRMAKITTALSYGTNSTYPGGPIARLKDTILYNFGVPIHYYARIDIEGFKQVVDAIDGIDVAVSCRTDIPVVQSRDPLVIETERLEPGMYHMDGELALWYARSRTNSDDFHRGRRQQQVLSAILNTGVDLNLLPQVPALFEAYRDTVDTDLDIGRILQLAAVAPAVRANGLQHLFIVDGLESWSDPSVGAAQLPRWEILEGTFSRLFVPSDLNSGMRSPVYVEIVNGTDNPDLAQLAADNLAYYGFVPVISSSERTDYEQTTLTYYGNNFKGSFDWLISWILGMRQGEINLIPDTPSDYNYQLVLGADYNPCVNHLFAPKPFTE